jgi:NDP-sugar pyrophosphorylase family protein
MKAVIQAGGKGTRLLPYTSVLPKPLMPIGARPVLELLLRWLRRNNIEDVYITTGYLGHLIRSFCGDGQQWGLKITYTHEVEPLGTVGSLTLLREHLDGTFLMLNGDVLTDLNLQAFGLAHRKYGGPLTIATTVRSTRMDFGIIEDQENRITSFTEKPTLSNSVSMGVYCMEPEVIRYIPAGIPFGLDDLALCMLEKDVPIHVFKHQGLWLDIGRVEDFHNAQDIKWEERAPSLLAVAS